MLSSTSQLPLASPSRPMPEAIPSYPPPSYSPPAAHFVVHHSPSTLGIPSRSKPSRFGVPSHSLMPPEEDTVVPTLSFSRRDDIDPGMQEGIAMGPLGEGGPSTRRSLDSDGRSQLELGGREEKVALVALFGSMMAIGWNDSSVGPLLTVMGEHYQVSYLVLSIIFLSHFLGYVIAGMSNIWLTDQFGFGRVIVLGACFPIVSYAIQSIAPPFPTLCVTYVLSGVGVGLQDTQTNAFVARLPSMLSKISFLHAAFGVGALASPLVSTQFAQLSKWHYYYLVSLGLGLLNLAILVFVFRLRTEESLLGPAPVEELSPENSSDPLLQLTSRQKMHKILSTPLVHVYSAFLFCYAGLEMTMGSYTVTFLAKARNGGSQSGLVSSGFFLGLTLGRLVFPPLNRRLGEKIVTLLSACAALGLECVVWFVPSIVGNAVAVVFVGFVLGPVYPMVISSLTKILPRHLHSGAVGWVASFSQAGSALFPFLTGILAAERGIEVVPAVLVAILGTMLVLWLFTPKVPRRLE